MSTKSKIVLSFGLFLAAVSAAAAAPHQANIRTSQLGVAQSNDVHGPTRELALRDLIAEAKVVQPHDAGGQELI